MINVNSALLTDDLTGVHNNYIRGFIYDQPQPQHCKSAPAAAHHWNQVPDGGAVQEPKEHNSLQNHNHQITFFRQLDHTAEIRITFNYPKLSCQLTFLQNKQTKQTNTIKRPAAKRARCPTAKTIIIQCYGTEVTVVAPLQFWGRQNL